MPVATLHRRRLPLLPLLPRLTRRRLLPRLTRRRLPLRLTDLYNERVNLLRR
jgi:hypothetical protein